MSAHFISDLHVGNHAVLGGPYRAGLNRRCQLVVDTVRRAARMLGDNSGVLVVPGDLYDTDRPSPQIQAALGAALQSFGMPVEVLLGNHDITGADPGDNALAPLHLMEPLCVWDRPGAARVGLGWLLMVPFQAGEAMTWLPGAVAEAAAARDRQGAPGPTALVIHLGLRTTEDKKTPWAAASKDAVDLEPLAALCHKHDVRAVFAGNWHGYMYTHVKGVDLVQVGTLCPTGWDNPGLEGYGRVVTWDPKDPRVHGQFEVPGPRFIERIPAVAPPEGFSYFVKLKVRVKEVAAARADLAAAKAAGVITDGLVVLDDQETKEVVAKAASGATSKLVLDTALREHVAGMKLPTGVQADDVIAKSLAYLGGGR